MKNYFPLSIISLTKKAQKLPETCTSQYCKVLNRTQTQQRHAVSTRTTLEHRNTLQNSRSFTTKPMVQFWIICSRPRYTNIKHVHLFYFCIYYIFVYLAHGHAAHSCQTCGNYSLNLLFAFLTTKILPNT